MKKTILILIASFLISAGMFIVIKESSSKNRIQTPILVDKENIEKVTDTKKENIQSMSEEKAREIAKMSECVREGLLKDNAIYNDYTKTWWIDLDIDKPGCNPACVIFEDERVEINWRCTGLIEN